MLRPREYQSEREPGSCLLSLLSSPLVSFANHREESVNRIRRAREEMNPDTSKKQLPSPGTNASRYRRTILGEMTRDSFTIAMNKGSNRRAVYCRFSSSSVRADYSVNEQSLICQKVYSILSISLPSY